MHIQVTCVALLLTAPSLLAQGALDVSIAVRETGFAGSLVGTVGDNGGATGGIEWVNRDGQSLPVDGQWHTFTFNLTTDPILGFAGTSANSILEGNYGTIEHIRVLNSGGITDPITLLIDDVTNISSTVGVVNFGDFSNYVNNDPAMFRWGSYSGSTSGNLMTGSTAGVENDLPVGSEVYRESFQFIDNSPTRWVRLTTHMTTNQPNPVVRFDGGSVVTIRMMAYTECLPDLGSQGPGNLNAMLCGDGLNANEAATLSIDGAPANGLGAITVSLNGLPDLPVIGGNVVSGAGFLFSIPVFADATGYASLTIGGDPTVVNFALQGLFFDATLPQGIAFSNAVLGSFGQ